MAASKRHPTGYPGVYFRLAQRLTGKGEEKVYYCTYKVNGKKVEVRLGRQYRDDMTPARAALMRADLIEGRRQSPQERRREEAARLTIATLWEAYKLTLTNKRTVFTDTSNFKWIAEAFANKTVNEISTEDIDAMRDNLLQARLAPQTVKHALSLLRRIIRHGAKKCLCQMPVNLFFNMPAVDNAKTENLSQDQLQKLLEALDADKDQVLASMMRFALATGLRRGALLALEWRDVDFEAGFITLRGETAKSGKTTRIPMNPAARQILENTPVIAGRSEKTDFVFPNASGNKRQGLDTFFKRIQKAAKLPADFRPLHGLRHTFASFLASSGEVDLYTLQRLLTHSSPMMTQRYAHLADEAMQRAAGVAEGLFGKTQK